MVKVEFEFRDEYSNGRWIKNKGIYEDLRQCYELNGLGVDCEYKIISIEEV